MTGRTREFAWTSKITEVWKDPQACVWGSFCPCVLFGRNVTRITDGQVSFLKGCLTHALYLCAPCHAAPFRQQLRRKRNLPEDPHGDLNTHIFCHLCALCQEKRELDAGESAPIQGPPKSTVDRGSEETKEHLEAIQQQKMER